MIYETLSQPLVFLILAIAGFSCGVFFDLAHFLSFLCEKSKFFSHFFSFFASASAFLLFSLVNLYCNFGRLRFFPLLTFIIFLLLQRLSLGKLFAQIGEKCYNKLAKYFERKRNERQRKKGKENKNNIV